MSALHRRQVLSLAVGAAAGACFPRLGVRQEAAAQAAAEAAPAAIGLGFSLYGMKTLSLADAIAACAKLGYDGVEWSALADWPGEAAKLSAEDRKQYRQRLADAGLDLHAVMENLPLLTDDEAKRKDNLARLAKACELAHHLSPGKPSVVETVLGGKPGDWDNVKSKMVERLMEWAAVAEKAQTVLCIKPHVANALQTPEDCVWLASSVNNKWLRLAYDYSHFGLQKLDLAESLATMAPQTAFVHVKDYQGEPGKFKFLLPGDGPTDWTLHLKRLAAERYAGNVVVEVSGQIFNQPGYDPLAAAEKCYAKLAPAWKAAGVGRPG